MSTVKQLTTAYQDDFGEEVGGENPDYLPVERIPTGIFELDMALGGGFPRGRCCIIYGPESSCKTNIALLLIASHQRKWPDKKCVFFDMENVYDRQWSKLLGVDVERLYVYAPNYAEQCVNMVEGLLEADDCGIVVIDSVAALITAQEMGSDAEKAIVGGAGLAMGKMVRKSTLAMAKSRKEGRHPTLIYVNQIRFKIGVMFGSPETIPGGGAQKFQSSLTLRVWGKNVKDETVSKTMPCRKDVTAVVQKWKVRISSVQADFSLAMLPHKGLKPGQSNEWGTVFDMMEAEGIAGKDGKRWFMTDGEGGKLEFKTKIAMKDRFYGDEALADMVREALIESALDEAHGVVPTEAELVEAADV